MPGKRATYEAAMREAADAAWDHQWPQAVAAYQAALAEFPEDTNALSGLGMALVESDQLDEALNTYGRLAQAAPGDPLAVEKSAEVLERMGHLDEAGKRYVAVAEIHLANQNIGRAIANWERAVHLIPDDVKLRSRLAIAYERTKQARNAVREYVALAAMLQAGGDVPKATEALQRALKIDPTNESVRNSLGGLRGGAPVELLEDAGPSSVQGRGQSFDEDFAPAVAAEASPASPKAMAAEYAMGELAVLLFDEGLSEKVTAAVAAAVEHQRAGDAAEAAGAYEQAMRGGLDHPAAWLNLGMVYHQVGDARKARNALQQIVSQPEYALAANLSLGQVFAWQEKWPDAARHLIEALRYADLWMSPGDEAEVAVRYNALLDEIQGQNAEKLQGFCKNLSDALDADDWQRRVKDIRGRLGLAADDAGMLQTILEPGSEKLAQLLDNIHSYTERGMFPLAMEEAHYALELSPFHLPVHTRMAEIMARENRHAAASTKYTIVAHAYLVRGEHTQAADMYAAALKLSPLDLNARRRLIDMLLQQGRGADAIKHYEELAEVYLTMADTDNARKTYEQAVELANQFGADPELIARLLHQLADLSVQKLDWRQALRSYEDIRQIIPGDEAANLAIVDLNFRLGQGTQAVKQLDEYLGYCIRHGKLDRVAPVLEEQVRNRPEDAALRQRLAKVYQEQNRQAEAIAQLDALGELLLEAGQQEDAIKTIRQIVEMNPPDVDGYRQLLRQMEGMDTS